MNDGWAVVTGASSRIGLAFAREFSRRGYPVLAIARRRERLEDLAKAVVQRGGPIEPLAADLNSQVGLESVLGRVDQLGQIEFLVNNAGVATAGDFIEASLPQEIAEIRLNVEAVVTLTHRVLRGMVRSRRGAVINLASSASNLSLILPCTPPQKP